MEINTAELRKLAEEATADLGGYIRAANPSTILALLDRVESAERCLEAQRKSNRAMMDSLAEQSEMIAAYEHEKLAASQVEAEPVAYMHFKNDSVITKSQHLANPQARGSYNVPLVRRAWATPPPAPAAIPDGHALVPLEPTTDMLDKGADFVNSSFSVVSAGDVYRAMLAAAPAGDKAVLSRGDAGATERCPHCFYGHDVLGRQCTKCSASGYVAIAAAQEGSKNG